MKPINGIIVVDKPVGPTSAAAVGKIKRRFKPGKIGHTGTLDPLASGMLVLVVGTATKVAGIIQGGRKTYEAQLRFGFQSTTQDAEGELTEISANPQVEAKQLDAVLETFLGPQKQLPPQFSAKKLNGQTAHKVARKGGSLELKPANIVIYSISRIDSTCDFARIRVECSAGTYIRTLCHDIGQTLEVGAYMTALRRQSIGRLSESAMQPLEELLEKENLSDVVQPVTHDILMAPRVMLTAAEHRTAFHGQNPGVAITRVQDICDENRNMEYIVGYDEDARAAVLFNLPQEDAEDPDHLVVRRVIEAPDI